MGEISGDPWCKERSKSIDKIKSDKNKLFRIMKDTYDSIVKHYVKKSNSFTLENFKDLELYGFLISGKIIFLSLLFFIYIWAFLAISQFFCLLFN